MSSRRERRVRDKWRDKEWYVVLAPSYFGEVELGAIPSDNPQKLIGRVVDATLYDLTNDFTHQYLKMYFRVTNVKDKTANTVFKGHEYSQDYLRSLVRRRTTRIDGVFNVKTKDGYQLRLTVCAFSLTRVRTTQERLMRSIMKKIIEEKAVLLTYDQFVQEVVLGKIASDIYNEAKKISPLRHIGIRKSKLILEPTIAA